MPYLVRHTSPAAPTLRLVCFPHAGGGASFFRGWSKHLAPSVELLAVQYPGRENRFTEPLVGELAPLAAGASAELLAEPALPTVLFGHSMGAMVAYETLLRLEASGATHFTRLCASGRALDAPPVGAGEDTDAELIAAVKALGGTNAQVWDNPELSEMLLPIIRNDYRLIDAYRRAPGIPKLRAEVLALSGDADPRITPDQATLWATATTGPFASQVFEGAHFYLTAHAPEVARRAVAAAL
ncbi:alpha/beta fold hydrolase [Streptomyces sp. NBC_00536]|uniref:thioesterase II family protein n=1 Tax=Streptomyces sp. NBC_00536 TaxID=2975769 RepID=UPI002E8047B5|nr:alpha/beta fold hydrolase [Streptomyces sp. NBC_00536]WUC82046.1 alpha/beta fold hydrolase [Streptomyces sp. NBC_00536]